MKKLIPFLLFFTCILTACYDDEDNSLELIEQEPYTGNSSGIVSGKIGRKTVTYEDYIEVTETFPSLQRVEIRRNLETIVFRFPIGDTGLLIPYSGWFENHLGRFSFYSGRAGRNFHITENDTASNLLKVNFRLRGNILNENGFEVGEFDIQDGIMDLRYED